MIEHFDDVVGPSARLHNNEERSWKRSLDKLDCIDHYMTVADLKGPVFTRQAVCGTCFDQSRLDRIYSSHRGQWYAYIKTIEDQTSMDGRQTLLDHIHVTSCIVLKVDLVME